MKKTKKKLKENNCLVESLTSEIDRLRASIPDDESCESCQVLHSELETARTINASTLVQLRDVTAKLDELRLAHDSCDEKLKLANDEIEKLKFSSPKFVR